MTKQLHNLALVESVQSGVGQDTAADLAESDILNQDTQVVRRPAGGQAPDLSLSGVILDVRRAYPTLVADELRELAGADLGSIPVFRPDGEYPEAGYYHIANASVTPPHAVEDAVAEYEIALTRAGTRGGHYRAVAYGVETRSHPFGSGTRQRIAVPGSARATRWYTSADRTTSRAESAATVTTAQGDLAEYDISNAPSDADHLLYDLPYSDDPVGVRAYDSLGRSDKFDSDGIRHWQTLHETQHDIGDTRVILSNGRIRLRVALADSPNGGRIEYAEYSGGWDIWSDISPSNYDPVDLDITDIDQQRVDAQLTFRDLSTGGTDDYAVDLSLTLASPGVLVAPAENESSGIPSDIQTALDPAARDSERDTRATRALIERSRARR